jgi:hypothetical protein
MRLRPSENGLPDGLGIKQAAGKTVFRVSPPNHWFAAIISGIAPARRTIGFGNRRDWRGGRFSDGLLLD